MSKKTNIHGRLTKMYAESLVQLLNDLQVWQEDYDGMTFSQKREFERQKVIANEMADITKALSENAELDIKDYLRTQGSNSYAELNKRIGLDNTFIDADLLETILNKPVAGVRLSQRLHKDRNRLAVRSTNAIRMGLIKGDGYDKIARRLSDLNEASFNNAMRIVRTESGRISLKRHKKGYEDAKALGIKLRKEWVSGNDKRTRDSHARLNGTIIDIDDEFEIDGHTAIGPGLFGIAGEDINCRCTTVEVVVEDKDKTVDKGDNSFGLSDNTISKLKEPYSKEQFNAFIKAYNPADDNMNRVINDLFNSGMKLMPQDTKSLSYFRGGAHPEMLVKGTNPRHFYHESGHGIDWLLHKDINTGIYDLRMSISETVKKDLDNTIFHGVLEEERGLNRRTKVGKARYNEIYYERRQYIEDFEKFLDDPKHSKDDLAGIYDLVTGAGHNISSKNIVGGHADGYWRDETNLGNEAMAHIIGSMATQSKDMDILKKFLPDTFKMIEGKIKKY
ncbi:phage minor head protein [Weissella ceti]|uniref:NAD(+)--arginine ADP-ribosyltransferase EFV n=1 Tax=Weissella ceti TaxID=759620 RepID=A0A088GG37_9LACO|nr:phage minor head protein [Weissella ceti]AIM63073.1 NAD(+)--arginine ADP-ribosyltransferase EFV [Weissella ceti]